MMTLSGTFVDLLLRDSTLLESNNDNLHHDRSKHGKQFENVENRVYSTNIFKRHHKQYSE